MLVKIWLNLAKNQKSWITGKLFQPQVPTKLIMRFFFSAVPLLKEYILLFVSSVHILYDKQWDLLKRFLFCFLKPEDLVAVDISSKEIKNLKTEDPPKSSFYIINLCGWYHKATQEVGSKISIGGH